MKKRFIILIMPFVLAMFLLMESYSRNDSVELNSPQTFGCKNVTPPSMDSTFLSIDLDSLYKCLDVNSYIS